MPELSYHKSGMGMPKRTYHLTEREKEVFALIAKGQRNADIAQALSISVYTVQNHIQNLFRKLGVCNRTEAASKFREEAVRQHKNN